jgi:hypothetical protein
VPVAAVPLEVAAVPVALVAAVVVWAAAARQGPRPRRRRA